MDLASWNFIAVRFPNLLRSFTKSGLNYGELFLFSARRIQSVLRNPKYPSGAVGGLLSHLFLGRDRAPNRVIDRM
jgi:hypothetical protein